MRTLGTNPDDEHMLLFSRADAGHRGPIQKNPRSNAQDGGWYDPLRRCMRPAPHCLSIPESWRSGSHRGGPGQTLPGITGVGLLTSRFRPLSLRKYAEEGKKISFDFFSVSSSS